MPSPALVPAEKQGPVIHLPRKYSRFGAEKSVNAPLCSGVEVYQKDHALCPRPRSAVGFNLLFAGLSISTLAVGEFSNSPPAYGTGASAFIGVLAPIRIHRTAIPMPTAQPLAR